MSDIEISSMHIDPLIEMFTREEQEADKLIREAYSKKQAAIEMLKQLHKLKNDIAYVSNRFTARNESNFIWLKKVKFVLEKHGPMTMPQIVDRIINEYGADLNRKLTTANVSAVLSTNSIEGKELVKTNTPSNENVYMLKPEANNIFLGGKTNNRDN